MVELANDLYVRLVAAAPRWDVAADAPEVLAHVPPDAQRLAAALAAGVPALRMVGPQTQEPYLRPPLHRRTFFIRLDRGVLGVKGSEPLALNFADLIAALAGSQTLIELRLGNPAVDRTLTRAELSGLDKFPILEGKVPGCLTLAEALEEALAAAAVHRAHAARHGGPALLPIPLFVGRWPDSVHETVLDTLRPRLRGRALHVVESAVAAGLGTYVYYYPTMPVRLAELNVPDIVHSSHVAKRRALIEKQLDPSALFDAWIGGVARLLALGFVPKDPDSIVSGDCLQVQNLVLDGGFADTGSIVASSRLGDRALRDAIRRTVHELALAGTRLTVGLWVSTVELRDRLPDLYVVAWNALAARVAAEQVEDARVLDILRPGHGALDEITTIFTHGL